MWLKAQNEMEGFLPHAAMGPVERMVRPQRAMSLTRALGQSSHCTQSIRSKLGSWKTNFSHIRPSASPSEASTSL